MAHHARCLAAATASILLIGAAGAELPRTAWPEDPNGQPAARVLALYSSWKASRVAPGDEMMRIPLRWAKGISVAAPLAGGMARLDLAHGTVSVELWGLDGPAEVWLVDNRPAPGATTLPDPGDGTRQLGTLSPSAGRAELAAALGTAAFDAFEVDRIVVSRAGRGPGEGILLLGGPSSFERLYTRERGGRMPPGVPMEAILADLVVRGEALFEDETFDGNGRTCATCHPAVNNFTIDPRFIATLPDDDPLFVAEFDPALADLENPRLLRERGLILENLDGFERPGVMRGVPHTLGLGTSVRGPEIPFDNTANPAFGIVPPAERTGWSGDGAPGSGALRDFAVGAVIQHFPRSLAREAGRDFRLPTDDELDALELFQLSLGRSRDPEIEPSEFRSPVVRAGAEIFERTDTEGGTRTAGKCSLCHSQAGANIDSEFFERILGAPVSGNANFGTGVNDLAALPSDLIDPEGDPQDGGFARVPHDGVNCQPPRGGFGTVTPEGGPLPAGLCEEDFNTPSLVEAADTPPFFHNNAVDTLEGAVAFYDDAAFNASAGGQLLASLDSGGVGIRLATTEVAAVGAFLRVVNALENIRESSGLMRQARKLRRSTARKLLERALAEQTDAIEVLEAAGLHPEVVARLRRAGSETRRARGAFWCSSRRRHIERAIERLEDARAGLVVARRASPTG